MSARFDDDELLHIAVRGGADALETLLLRHFDRLVADVDRRIPDDIRGTISAEDVVQDAFIVVFQRIRSFEPQGPQAFFGWLSTIAQNRLMDAAKALRAAKRGGGMARLADGPSPGAEDDHTPLIEALAAHSRTPSRSAAVHELGAALTAALEALPPDYGEALRLRYIEAQPIAACAQALRRSEGAVHMLLSRALAALRANLGDSGRFLTRKQ